MDNVKISPNELSREVWDIMRAFNGKVSAVSEITAEQVAKETVEDLRRTSPKGATKNYSKSWAKKRDIDGSFIVYNEEWRLPHLLEKPHQIISWGKYKGMTEPVVHIKPAEEKAIKRFENLLKENIEKGL